MNKLFYCTLLLLIGFNISLAQSETKHTVKFNNIDSFTIVLPNYYDTLFSWEGSGLTSSGNILYRFQPKKYKIQHSTLIPEPPYILCLTVSFPEGLPINEGDKIDIKGIMSQNKTIIQKAGNVSKFEIDSTIIINNKEFVILAWDNKYPDGPTYKRLSAYTLVNNNIVLFNFANSTEFNRETFIAESLKQLKTVEIFQSNHTLLLRH